MGKKPFQAENWIWGFMHHFSVREIASIFFLNIIKKNSSHLQICCMLSWLWITILQLRKWNKFIIGVWMIIIPYYQQAKLILLWALTLSALWGHPRHFLWSVSHTNVSRISEHMKHSHNFRPNFEPNPLWTSLC